MSKPPSESWEKQVADVAPSFSYPPTPNIADGIRQRQRLKPPSRRPRRLVVATFALLFLLIGLISVPTGRASIMEFLQFGAIRIWFVEPTPTASSCHSALRQAQEPRNDSCHSERNEESASSCHSERNEESLFSCDSERNEVAPTEALFVLDDDIMGALTETTLAQAEEQTDFSIRLPTYPPTLGTPDRIFTLDPSQDGVLLVWLVPGSQNQVGLSLHQFNYELSSKKTSDQLDYVRVNGKPALWLSQPHNLYLNTSRDKVRRVKGNVLIWVENQITYRLETKWPLSEALPFAESLVEKDD